MKRLAAIIGLMTLLPSPATAAEVPPLSLYDFVEETVKAEQQIPDQLAQFLALTFGSEKTSLTAQEVIAALEGDIDPLCGKLGLSPYGLCPMRVEEMRRVAGREQRIWKLGNRLQTIASSYEEPASAFSREPSELLLTFESILRTWGIGGGDAENLDYAIRSLDPPGAVLNAALGIEPELNALRETDADGNETNADQRTAAVWRYHYGLRFVQQQSPSENPDSESGPDTERRLLFRRFPEIEGALQQIISSLPTAASLNLRPGEAAIFLMENAGGANVTVWAYVRDARSDARGEILPSSDAGLSWNAGLKPVPLSLIGESGSAIPGGKFPPPPALGRNGDVTMEGGGGICASLAGSRSYLCKARKQKSQTDNCSSQSPEPGKIILTPCERTAQKDYCADIEEAVASGSLPCEPGSEASYPFTVLGHACFIRACAERSKDHGIVPGRDALVSQESAYPWNACIKPPLEEEPLAVPPPADLLPLLPEYNPAARALELDILYCRIGGRPPLSPPSVCDPSISNSYSRLQAEGIGTATNFVVGTDLLTGDQFIRGMETMGAEAAGGLYKEYLRQASRSLQSVFETAVTFIKRIAETTFPETMCPLNPEDTRLLCPSAS